MRMATGSQTLKRGLRVLRVLADDPGGLTVSALAREMGTHRAGIYRLLAPLLAEGFVVRDETGRHRLGVGLLELSRNVQPSLQTIAAPLLQDLADKLGATAALTVRDDDHAVTAMVVEPRTTELHIAYRTGLRHPVARSAAGIAILAAAPPETGERDEVRVARERGWAVSHGELLPGTTGIGASVAGATPPASVSAVWIASRDPAEAAPAVVACASQIAAQLPRA